MRFPGRKGVLALGAVVLVAAVAVIAVTARADSRLTSIRDSIEWDDSCASVRTSDNGDKSGWSHATKTAVIACEHLGPLVLYARFDNEAELREDLLRRPPSQPTCVAGREVLVDHLDPGQFVALCRRLRGDHIDALSKLPDIPWDGTVGDLDATVDVGERRDAAAQGRALRRYFG